MKTLKLKIHMFDDTKVVVGLNFKTDLQGIDDTVTAIEKFKDKLKDVDAESLKVKVNFDNMTKSVVKASNNAGNALSKGFKTVLTSLGVSASIAGITKSIKKAVTAAASYEEARNLFVMAVGEYKDENFEWAKKISSALYLDDSEILQYTGSFYNLTKGLGAASDAANLMSKNLTQLTYDMSSYLNIDVSVANTKLMSAMSGQTKAVTSVGIAVQQASLQELAYSLGVKKSVSQMTQAEKTYLRYIQIMRSTKQMQGDLGRTIITPTNAFRMLSTQVTLLGRALGQMLTPVIYKFMPMLIALTRVITQAATALAHFLGYDIQEIDYSSVGKTTDAIKDLGKEVDKTGAKVNKMLAPFDQLNVVESKGGGGGGNVGDSVLDQLGKYLEGYDMLESLNEKMSDSIAEWENRFTSLGKVILPLLAAIAGYKILKWLGDVTGAIGGLTGQTGLGGISGLLKNIGTEGSITGGIFKNMGGNIKTFLAGIAPVAETIGGILLVVQGNWEAYNAGIKTAQGDVQGYTSSILGFLETVGGWGLTLTGLFGFPGGTIAGLLIGLVNYSAVFGTSMQNELDKISVAKIDSEFGGLQISTEQWLNTLTTGSGSLGEIVKKLQEYENSLHKTDDTLNTNVTNAMSQFALYRTGVGEYATISESMIQTITTDMNNITETASTGIKTFIDTQLTWMQEEYDKGDAATKEYYKKQMEDLTKNGKDTENEIKTNKEAILKIWRKAQKEHRNVNDEEWLEIQQHLKNINDAYDTFAGGFSDDLARFFDKNGKLESGYNQESIKNFIETKNKYLEEQKKNADEVYKHEVEYYDRLKNTGKMKQDEYDKAVEQANTNREKAIAKSNEVVDKYMNQIRTQVISNYTEMLTDTEKWNDNDRKILEGTFKDLDINPQDYWNKIETYASEGAKILEDNAHKYDAPGRKIGDTIVGGITSTITDKLKKTTFTIKTESQVSNDSKTIKFTPKNVTAITAKADGGPLNYGEMFIANEAGPEFITRIGNKSAVINQNQMAEGVARAVVEVAKSLTGTTGKSNQPIVINLGNETLWSGKVNHDKQQLDRYGSSSVINI